MQRRLTIRSNPPGALVYVDDYQIGTTPVSTDFVYYGTRKVRLVKSGHETLTVLQGFADMAKGAGVEIVPLSQMVKAPPP